MPKIINMEQGKKCLLELLHFMIIEESATIVSHVELIIMRKAVQNVVQK